MNILRKIQALILAITLSGLGLSAQQDHPEPVFRNGLQPNWTYFSYDSNFIQSPLDPFSSPYWGRNPINVIITDSTIYLHESCFSQSPYSGAEGFLLHALDHSGKPRWIHHSNTYTGNVFREVFDEKGIRLEGDEIIITGFRDVDSIDFSKPNFVGVFGNPLKRTLDRQSGATKEVIVGQQNFKKVINAATSGVNAIYPWNDTDVIQFNNMEYLENGKLIKTFAAHQITENMEVDTTPLSQLTYDTRRMQFAYEHGSQRVRLNSDTMVITWFRVDTNTRDTIDELILVYIDANDLTNIRPYRSLDLTQQLSAPIIEGFLNLFIAQKDNQVFVFQRQQDFRGNVNQINFLWFDKLGNRLSRIEDAKYGVGEPYKHLSIVGLTEKGSLILIGQKDDLTHDVLRIDPDQDMLSVIGAIDLEPSPEFYSSYIFRGDIIGDSTVLIHFRLLATNENNRRTNFDAYINFNLSDLGITTPVFDRTASSELKIYPNPTIDRVYIEIPEKNMELTEIRIYNQEGVLISTEMASLPNGALWADLTELAPGAYVIQVISENGQSQSVPIIKE